MRTAAILLWPMLKCSCWPKRVRVHTHSLTPKGVDPLPAVARKCFMPKITTDAAHYAGVCVYDFNLYYVKYCRGSQVIAELRPIIVSNRQVWRSKAYPVIKGHIDGCADVMGVCALLLATNGVILNECLKLKKTWSRQF